MKNKLTIYLILLLFTYSCTGLGSKRSQKSDEFLVEKKKPSCNATGYWRTSKS